MASGVDGGQCGHRLSSKAQPTIGIIFEDGDTRLLCQRDDALPALDAHGGARRVVKGRDQVHELEALLAQGALHGLRAGALCVHGHRDVPGTVGVERLHRTQERGTLDQDGISWIDQQARDEIQRLLRSADDHDVLAGGRDPARAHVLRERIAQQGLPIRKAILERFSRVLIHHGLADRADLLQRKQLGLRPATCKGDHLGRLSHLEDLANNGSRHPLQTFRIQR